ncbi:MAG: nucleoside recognition domain-containing protein [Oscillospiraceae bacterium]
MKAILAALPAAAIICGLFTGRLAEVSAAVLEKAGEAVALAITLCGVMCLWSGLMRVAEEAGAVRALSSLLSPVVSLLFRGLEKGGRAMQLICTNLSANILGLGNATTPLGIRAMEAIAEEEAHPHAGEASDNMIMLTVLNTASLQVIPATAAAMRAAHGAQRPMDILPCVWIVSAYSLAVAVGAAKLLGWLARVRRKRRERRADN